MGALIDLLITNVLHTKNFDLTSKTLTIFFLFKVKGSKRIFYFEIKLS